MSSMLICTNVFFSIQNTTSPPAGVVAPYTPRKLTSPCSPSGVAVGVGVGVGSLRGVPVAVGDAEGSVCGVGVGEGVGSASAVSTAEKPTQHARFRYLIIDFIV